MSLIEDITNHLKRYAEEQVRAEIAKQFPAALAEELGEFLTKPDAPAAIPQPSPLLIHSFPVTPSTPEAPPALFAKADDWGFPTDAGYLTRRYGGHCASIGYAPNAEEILAGADLLYLSSKYRAMPRGHRNHFTRLLQRYGWAVARTNKGYAQSRNGMPLFEFVGGGLV